jgi:hypothetical protein
LFLLGNFQIAFRPLTTINSLLGAPVSLDDANNVYLVYGTWDSNAGTFTGATNAFNNTTANDALVVFGENGTNLTQLNSTGYTIFENLGGAFSAVDFLVSEPG